MKRADSYSSRMDADRLLALPPLVICKHWSQRDTVLYNLGIGLGELAVDRPDCLPYVLDDRARGFPTMPTVMGRDMRHWEDPANGVDFSMMVHGEEWIEILAPVPAAGPITSSERIEEIWDKGSGKAAIASTVREIAGEDGVPFARCGSILVIRDAGGFGGRPGGPPKGVAPPERAPDGEILVTTRKDQAVLYRLSGDLNPLHFDPFTARKAGFDGPVLMGLCTMGIAARGITLHRAGPSPEKLRALRVRFTDIVYPGETLRIDYWNLPDREVAFRASVDARHALVLGDGRAKFD